MPKNLIYANADEFHVKSTVVYAKETDDILLLYWDSECTKPIYSGELERLYLAGGLKVDFGEEGTGMADVIAKPVGKSGGQGMVTVMRPSAGATGVGEDDLYYDEASTKPVYADELKRLFFAGGLKICYPMPIIESGTTQTVFLSPIGFNEFNGVASVACLANLDNMLTFSARARSVSSDDSLVPAVPAVEG